MKSIDPKELAIPEVHQLLLGSVGPRPIAFASTISSDGIPNLSPFSFFNVFSANPPILVFSPARSGRTKLQKDTYHNVKAVPEVVINVVTMDMVQQMSLSSSPYPPEVNEFVKSGFTPVKSEVVAPSRVLESPVQFECKVNQVIELGDGGGAGNLIICEVVRIHVNEELFNEAGRIDQKKINLVSRMGGNWYCHANEHSMFEVQKPLTTIGIGFDQIPSDILQSEILSANDLGLLASVEELPDETAVNEYKLLELSELFIELEDQAVELEQALHREAKKRLSENQVTEAWMTLLSFNN
ncbi:MAG: flavin reductase family protein [Bacteroidetes bacterium]|nr:MAG: flavin reductase family protein [Bacteroidota bacterium]